MIAYTLPDFTVGLKRNLLFIRLLREHPEYFLDSVSIESVYGCFPSCKLNGGRAFIRERYSGHQMQQTFALLREYQVIPRLTFTNMLAKPEHLDDGYIVEMLGLAQRYEAEIIVYADEVADALRERYGFKCILSTTRGIEDIEELNRLTKRYDYLVLSYNKNKDYAFIDKIEDKGKIEIMVNEFCQYQCAHREEHYLHNSEDQMSNTMRPFTCYHQEKDNYFNHDASHPIFLTNDEVSKLNQEYGIEYFKIVGRGIPFEMVLESYVYSLIKPEFRESVKDLARRNLCI